MPLTTGGTLSPEQLTSERDPFSVFEWYVPANQSFQHTLANSEHEGSLIKPPNVIGKLHSCVKQRMNVYVGLAVMIVQICYCGLKPHNNSKLCTEVRRFEDNENERASDVRKNSVSQGP